MFLSTNAMNVSFLNLCVYLSAIPARSSLVRPRPRNYRMERNGNARWSLWAKGGLSIETDSVYKSSQRGIHQRPIGANTHRQACTQEINTPSFSSMMSLAKGRKHTTKHESRRKKKNKTADKHSRCACSMHPQTVINNHQKIKLREAFPRLNRVSWNQSDTIRDCVRSSIRHLVVVGLSIVEIGHFGEDGKRDFSLSRVWFTHSSALRVPNRRRRLEHLFFIWLTTRSARSKVVMHKIFLVHYPSALSPIVTITRAILHAHSNKNDGSS